MNLNYTDKKTDTILTNLLFKSECLNNWLLGKLKSYSWDNDQYQLNIMKDHRDQRMYPDFYWSIFNVTKQKSMINGGLIYRSADFVEKLTEYGTIKRVYELEYSSHT